MDHEGRLCERRCQRNVGREHNDQIHAGDDEPEPASSDGEATYGSHSDEDRGEDQANLYCSECGIAIGANDAERNCGKDQPLTAGRKRIRPNEHCDLPYSEITRRNACERP